MKNNIFKLLTGVAICLLLSVAPSTKVLADETTEIETTSSVAGGNISDIDIGFDENGNFHNGFENGDNSTNSINELLIKYKYVITAIGAAATLTMLVFFILNLTKVGASGTNSTARTQALHGLLWTGVATGVLGAVTTIFVIFYNVFK